MRRIVLAIIVMAMAWQLSTAPVLGGSDAPTATVRLYPDWRVDPRAYIALAVPLQGPYVTPDSIWREFGRSEAGSLPRRSNEAIAVALPEEQENRGVIDAMQGRVYAQLLRQGAMALRPAEGFAPERRPYLFVDASGEPIPDAKVEILIGEDEFAYSVAIAAAQLDAEGLLEPPQVTSKRHRLSFIVMHPDCGASRATLRQQTGDRAYQVFEVAALPKDEWCVFLDALGYPLAGAKVEVVTSGSWTHGRMTYLEPIVLDEAGRLRPPAVFTTLTRCSFVVSDPNYGIALIEPYDMTQLSPREPLKICVAPLAVSATPVDSASIWGRVVDSDKTPIPGAIVACRLVITPTWEPRRPWWPWPAQWNKEAKVLTNDRGQFAMCLPQANEGGKLGTPVPDGSQYEVTITPPTEMGCLPFQGRLRAGMETLVTLEGTAGGATKYEGGLVFEDERGPVTDPERISKVNLVIEAMPGTVPRTAYGYHHGEWLEKSRLPFGIYKPTADWDGKHYTFRPIMVVPSSPEVIVFKPWRIEPFETRYRGRVLNGISGDPIAGAIVMPESARGLDLARLDPEGIIRLDQQAGPQTVRTDKAGRFEITLPIVKQLGPEHAIVALKSEYLCFRQQRSFTASQDKRSVEFPPDADGRVILPDMKLYPAGAMTIEPNAPDAGKGKAIALDLLTTADTPGWFKSLQAPPERNSGGNVLYRADLRAGVRQTLLFPAHAKLTLRLQLPDERYAPVFIEDVIVGQGKTVDLGRIDFARAIPVTVKVIHPAGEPLEGVPVRCLAGQTGHPTDEAVTNAAGIARLRVAVHSTGRFVVQYDDPRTQTLTREETPYEVAGPSDAGREFTLKLSEEFIDRVLQ